MGSIIGNTFVRGTDQGAVVRAICELADFKPEDCFTVGQSPELLPLQAKGRLAGCFVSPSLNGWVGVFEQTIEGVHDLSPRIACQLSEVLKTTAVSFALAPIGVLSYCVAQNGEVLDEYEYFSDPTEREAVAYDTGRDLAGNPSIVAAAAGLPEAEHLLASTLGDESLGPSEVLERIASALGIRNWHVSHRRIVGYTHVEWVEGWNEFVVIPFG